MTRRRGTLVIAVAACCAAVAIALGFALPAAVVSPHGEGQPQRGSMRVDGAVYDYLVYIPPGLPAGAATPLVVALHGCEMTAGQMAAVTQYDALAARDRFMVLYPEVSALDASDHASCWMGAWAPDTDGRGEGDAGAIAAMTVAVTRRWHADPGRVYVIGISAGGFEASILGTDYPDLYAAIGVHSGAAYMGGVPACLNPGGTPADPGTVTGAALADMGSRARVMPVIVIHGDADPRVPYQCGQQAVSQWLRVDSQLLRREHRPGVPEPPTGIQHAVVPGGRAYTVSSYTDGASCLVAQFWTVHGMGHFWSGGSASPSVAQFSDPRGPSATVASWAFFSRWRLSGPASPCGR
jgi:poly(hydroxyalkanoate) depolymerase family esterase